MGAVDCVGAAENVGCAAVGTVPVVKGGAATVAWVDTGEDDAGGGTKVAVTAATETPY